MSWPRGHTQHYVHPALHERGEARTILSVSFYTRGCVRGRCVRHRVLPYPLWPGCSAGLAHAVWGYLDPRKNHNAGCHTSLLRVAALLAMYPQPFRVGVSSCPAACSATDAANVLPQRRSQSNSSTTIHQVVSNFCHSSGLILISCSKSPQPPEGLQFDPELRHTDWRQGFSKQSKSKLLNAVLIRSEFKLFSAVAHCAVDSPGRQASGFCTVPAVRLSNHNIMASEAAELATKLKVMKEKYKTCVSVCCHGFVLDKS